MAKQRSTFGKLERARAKQGRAKAKRERRAARGVSDPAERTVSAPERQIDPAFSASSPSSIISRARRVLVLAQEEARLLHHDFIVTEHLLLGLIKNMMAWLRRPCRGWA